MQKFKSFLASSITAAALLASVASPAFAAETGFMPERGRTALLITDPQNDFLSKDGKAYGLVAENLKETGTIDHIGELFTAAQNNGIPIFVSPHYYFPADKHWHHRGALQGTMDKIDMFRRSGPLSLDGFAGSGADFLDRYKPVIMDGKTIITSPHRIYGPESNDLVLQLRKHGIDTVILGGMAANLCTDSHMRELMEQGFNVIPVKDAVGAPGNAAYDAAIVNYGLIANAVWDTKIAVEWMQRDD